MADSVQKKVSEEPDSNRQAHGCFVNCSTCEYEENVYPARFEELTLPQGREIKDIKPNLHYILFVLDGMVRVRLMDETLHVYPGHAVFWVRNTTPEIHAVQQSKVVLLGFSNRVILGKDDWLAKIATFHRTRVRESVPTLKLDPMTMNVLLNVMPIQSPCYHILKQHDLFMSLANNHSEAELARFFNPILRASDDFRAFVIHNYTNGDSLEDIARKTNMSKSYFIRRFKEVFGMTAHQWLVKQKKQELVQMIAGGQIHTKTMADTLGFSDRAGLYQFCRKHFGRSITGLMEEVYQNNAPANSRR